MDVRETTVQELLGGERQFEVPLYQRAYSWSEPQLAQLWRDVLGVCADRRLRPGTTHFLGSLVLSPSPSLHPTGVQRWVVVDGQQRLTTLALLLAAVRDGLRAGDPEAGQRIDDLYLVNRWAHGPGRYKIRPTQDDQAAFFAAIDGQGSGDPVTGGTAVSGGGAGGIEAASEFFRTRILELAEDPDSAGSLANIEKAVLTGLSLVVITTGAADNVHRIFESLNNRGVPLTQGDLLRNYYFMRMPTSGDRVHRDVWTPLQHLLDGDELVTLLWIDLLADDPRARRVDVYRAHQLRLEKIDDEDTLVADLERLLRRARAFVPALRPVTESDAAVRRRFERLDRWRARTALPLLLVLLEARTAGTITDAELETDLLYVESVLVRRLIADRPTNNLNRTFVAAAVAMARMIPTPDVLRVELSRPQSHWSTDAEVVAAVRSEDFYRNGRSDQRQAVLSWLEESFATKEPVRLEKLTIEHVMPQTLSAAWKKVLADELGSATEVRPAHRAAVQTLANLTLTGYNSEMSNRPFSEKRVQLQKSGLRLNQQIATRETWGFREIAERAKELADRVIATWPGPGPIVEEPELPVWQLLERVVEAIPAGRWASYGDVAAAIGSHPVPVGVRLATADMIGAYRVLRVDGTVSPDFRWSDRGRKDTPQDVLRAEGVRFDSSGHAAPEQRLSGLELSDRSGLDVVTVNVPASSGR